MPTDELTKSLGDSNGLIASFIWGAIGTGFAAYGWKQKEMRHLFGGIALIAGSYFFANSALLMSIISIAIIIAIFWLKRYFP
jgi:hypothetical protein